MELLQEEKQSNRLVIIVRAIIGGMGNREWEKDWWRLYIIQFICGTRKWETGIEFVRV